VHEYGSVAAVIVAELHEFPPETGGWVVVRGVTVGGTYLVVAAALVVATYWVV